MRQKVILIICLITAVFLYGDWKNEITNCFEKAHDYSRMTEYLEKNITGIPDDEKPYAIIILGFAYKEMGNPVYEEKWITYYFENHEVADPDFSFLPALEQVKIYEYISHWKRLYPKIQQISINPKSKKVLFFADDPSLHIDIQVRAPSSISIKNNKMENLYTGYLNKGFNTVKIPISRNANSTSSHVFRMELRTGTIEIIKHLTLNITYQYPDNITFNPMNGEIIIKGMPLKEETSSESYWETKKEFDKKHFIKKGIIPLGIGCAAFLLRQFVIHPQRIKEDLEPGQRAFLYAVDETCLVFSIGISVSGVIQIIKSTKYQKIERHRIKQHPDAAQHNLQIKQLIREYQKKVFIHYQIIYKK